MRDTQTNKIANFFVASWWCVAEGGSKRSRGLLRAGKVILLSRCGPSIFPHDTGSAFPFAKPAGVPKNTPPSAVTCEFMFSNMATTKNEDRLKINVLGGGTSGLWRANEKASLSIGSIGLFYGLGRHLAPTLFLQNDVSSYIVLQYGRLVV